MKENIESLNKQLGDIHHVLLAGIVIFFLDQFGQLPTTHFNKNGLHDAGLFFISLLLYFAAVYWSWTLVNENQELDTPQPLYSHIKAICYGIAAILIADQLWAYASIKWLNLTIGGTSTNQAAIDAMSNTVAGNIMEWLTVIIVGPVVEEVLFRYAIMKPKSIVSKKSRIIRTIISIILFTVLHMLTQLLLIKTGAQAKAALFSTGQYLVVALVFSLNYYFRNNIKENIAMHMTYNSIVMLIKYL